MKQEQQAGLNEAESEILAMTDSLSNLLDDAYQHYSSGQQDQAESLLNRILTIDSENLSALKLLGSILFTREGPEAASKYFEHAVKRKPDDPDCCNNMGVLRWAQGSLNEAANFFQQAVSLDPNHARAQFNLGNILANQGDLEGALSAYHRSLDIDPDAADVQDSLGTLLQHLDKNADAITVYRKAVELAPLQGTYHANLANALNTAGFPDEAIERCQRAVKLDPKRVEFYLNLGSFLKQAGKLDDAVVTFRKALKLRPDSGAVYNNLASILSDQGRYEDALSSFQAANELEQNSPEILYNIAVTLHLLKRYQETVDTFKQVLSLKSDWAEVYVNMGNALYEQGSIDEALAVYDQALALNDRIVEAHRNRALLLQKFGRWQDALSAFNSAIALRPDDAASIAARGMLRLKLGDFTHGWRDYEWRFEAMGYDFLPEEAYRSAHWNGASFVGKTLIIYHEQGLGDALQLACYLPMVKARGGKVIVLCGPPLMRLLESQPHVDLALSRQKNNRLEYDTHVALMSLPRIFATTLDTIPSSVPYLDIEPEIIARWGKKIHPVKAFKVGLVWSGNPDQGDDKNRSCLLQDYAPLAEVTGVEFFSLQVGEAGKQAESPPLGMKINDFTADLHDFVETGALIKNLDLVITVDTSAAHLSGTMGCPVWTVLWSNSCFRYLIDREDSPWYPTMRLFRQPSLGDWTSVMKRVAERLAIEVDERTTQSNPA